MSDLPHIIDSIITETSTLSHHQPTLKLKSDESKTQKLSENALYGKIIADVDLQKKPIIPNLLTSRELVHKVKVTLEGTNLYLFRFATGAEKQRILLQATWSVMGYYVILRPWGSNLVPNEVNFSTTILWVHLQYLSYDHHTAENATKIGKMLESNRRLIMRCQVGSTSIGITRIICASNFNTNDSPTSASIAEAGPHRVWVSPQDSHEGEEVVMEVWDPLFRSMDVGRQEEEELDKKKPTISDTQETY